MRIRTKLVALLLAVSLIPVGIMGVLSLTSVNSVGEDALESTEDLAALSENKGTAIISNVQQRRIRQKAKDVAKIAKFLLESNAPVSIDELKTESDIQTKLKENVATVIAPGPKDLPENLKNLYGYCVVTCNNFGNPAEQENIGQISIIAHPNMAGPVLHYEDQIKGTGLENLTRRAIPDNPVSGTYTWTTPTGSYTGEKYSAWEPFKFTTSDGVKRTFALMATVWQKVYTRKIDELETQNKHNLNSAEQKVNNSISQHRTYTILGLAAIIVVVPIVGILFARTLVGPIEKLTDAADRLSKGEMDVDVTVDSEDEIGELSDAFQRMKNSLEKMMERLREE